MKKRMIGLLLCAAVLFSLTAMQPDVQAANVSGACGENLTFTLEPLQRRLTISGTGEMSDYYILTPAPWSASSDMIGEAVIEEGVTSIGSQAFYQCGQLRSVRIPESVTEVGEYAFGYCSSLTSAALPDGVTVVERGLFYGCGSLATVELPDSVTSIGPCAFTSCGSLTSITIPGSVIEIGLEAFKDCTQLREINYGGSEADWQKIETGEGNECLAQAVIHYSGAADDSVTPAPEAPTEPGTEAVIRTVRYYSQWDADEQTVFFGREASDACAVTDRTDSGFLEAPELYLHRYVLVELRTEEGRQSLVSMALPETDMGTVTEVSDTQLTIDGRTLHRDPGADIPDDCLDRRVVYHVYDGTLVGLEVLQQKTGFLTYVHPQSDVINICSDATMADSRIFWASSLMTWPSTAFLDVTGTKTDVDVRYLADSNRFVYEILPVAVYRENGFSAAEHGWPLVNVHWTFGYETDYTVEPWIYYAHGSSASTVVNMNRERLTKMTWNGSCFGLSLLAAAQYNGQVDLRPWFDRDGQTLNAFGFDCVDRNNGNNFCALYQYVDGRVVYNDAVIRMIEQAQYSQWSAPMEKIARVYRADDAAELVEYLSREDPAPVLVNMGGVHTVVPETRIKPVYIGNGGFVVLLYDCNVPEPPAELDDPGKWYLEQRSMLYLNTIENKIIRVDRGAWMEVPGNRITCYDISQLDESFFEVYNFDHEQLNLLFEAETLEVFKVVPETGDRTKVFEIVDGTPVLYGEDGRYGPFAEAGEDAGSVRGSLILPAGNYCLAAGAGAYIQCMYDQDIFVVGTDKAAEAVLDCGNDRMTILAEEADTGIECIHAGAEADFCTALSAVLDGGEYAAMQMDCAEKTAAVETNADAGAVTVSQARGETLIEEDALPVHVHQDLTYVEAAAPQCGSDGRLAHYLCSCGKAFADAQALQELSTVTIPAPGHSWSEYGDETVCTACGATAFRGDVNTDGRINSKDAVMVLRHFSGGAVADFLAWTADVNSDGKINSKDAVLILQLSSGIIIEFP